MKKNNIDNFYVGKLVFLTKMGHFNKLSLEDQKKYNEIYHTIINGAISLRPMFFVHEFTDWKKKLNYNSVFSIFYKINNGYYCLHNGNVYGTEVDDKDFIENVTPLKNCLPKIDYNVPDVLSNRHALKLFDLLFNKTKSKNLSYEKIKYNINDFCFGYVKLLTGFQKINDNMEKEERYKFINLAEQLLFQNDSRVLYGYHNSRLEDISDTLQIEYDYNIYYSLFYKLKKDNFYNLNNYQIYYSDDMVSNMNSFSDELKEKKIEYNKSVITIPKVLKLQKTINNSR